MIPPHTTAVLVTAFTLAAVNLVALFFFRNHVIKRRMAFALFVIAGVLALHAAMYFRPALVPKWTTTEELLLALALINSAIALLFNPWFSDRVRDRAPAVVQDAMVVGLFLATTLITINTTSADAFTSSAIFAAVLGFALQETLGNAFAGLAIQTEKPFRVGHWVTVAGYDGRVMEVTWRATKIRTKSGNLVTLPNNVVAREAITNYTEPTAPTRLFVEVGASYSAQPNAVRDAILTAVRRSQYVLSKPAPDCLLIEFASSSINYRTRFWIDDFEQEDRAKDQVRTAIYYEFARRGIEIPFPIQVEYSREEVPEDPEKRLDRYEALLIRVPVLAALFADGRRALAGSAVQHTYGDREVIVREGDPGASMFVVSSGEVRVTLANGHEVARTKEGGYFGEMSLLTGEPRSATVSAAGDCSVLEIRAEVFREYVTAHPEVIELLAAAAAERRRELDESRAAVKTASSDTHLSIAARMRRFFGLDE